MPNKSSLALQIALVLGTVLNPCAAFANVGDMFLYEKGGHVILEHRNGRSLVTRLQAFEPEETAAVAVKLTPPIKVREIQSTFDIEKHSTAPLINLEYTSGKDTKLRYSTIKVHESYTDIPKIIGTDAIVHRFAIIAAPDKSQGDHADFTLKELAVNHRPVYAIKLNERLSDGDPLVQHQ